MDVDQQLSRQSRIHKTEDIHVPSNVLKWIRLSSWVDKQSFLDKAGRGPMIGDKEGMLSGGSPPIPR
jgi:hypothetical protein